MISKVECLILTCDNCQEHFENWSGFAIFSDEQAMLQDAHDSDDWLILKDRQYCNLCGYLDEDNEIIINKSRTKAKLSEE